MAAHRKTLIIKLLFTQLHALKQLSIRLFTPPEYFTEKDISFIVYFLSILNNKNAHPVNLAAAAGGMDMLIPEWREVVPKSTVSKVVKRDSKEVRRWITYCLDRDSNICVRCGSIENISVHHICSWADFPELRISEENGITLCGDCHAKEHPKMGRTLFVKN